MAIIEFEHVSKIYKLGASRNSLREAVTQTARKLVSNKNANKDDQLFGALNDVSFQVEQGEVLGIIGHNGAGKSTILKLLSKVTFPTRGHIRTQGRMAALIELGAGFHQDLTGRENIYLNGSILGLKKREIDEQFESIVEFAELAKFIDTPVKRYSSGMYVRLAFAVAAHVKADLLLVDEVLSVGDMSFQHKSLARMNELRDNGATIVFISHNLGSIRAFCSRVILLQDGCIAAEGNAAEVIQKYRQLDQQTRMSKLLKSESENDAATLISSPANQASDTNLITKIELLGKGGQPVQEFQSTDSLTVRCYYDISRPIARPGYMIRVRRRGDSFVCFSNYGKPAHSTLEGHGMFEARIDQLLLWPGRYMLDTNIHSRDTREVIMGLPEPFSVTGELPDEDDGIYSPDIEWSYSTAELHR